MSGEIISLVIDGEEQDLSWIELAERLNRTGHVTAASENWLVVRAVQIFLVQIGMLMLEIGSVSAKNTKSMIIKNITNASIAAICFYLLGYGFSFGDQGDEFIGWGGFATKGEMFEVNQSYHLAHMFYNFCLLNLVPTIASGSLSERTNVVAYFVLTLFISTLVTPIQMHWIWSKEGWASYQTRYLLDTGALDYAGSCVIHVSGGVMALIGAIVVGPRKGRFEGEKASIRMPLQNVTYSALGAFFIWSGFYGINMGALLTFQGDTAGPLGRIAVNTTISATAASLVVTILGREQHHIYGHHVIGIQHHIWASRLDIQHHIWASPRIKEGTIEPYSIVNGICTGLVGSSAGCATMTTEGALATGILAGIFYFGISRLLCQVCVDDVSDVSPIHIGGGLAGILTAAVFTTAETYALAVLDSGDNTPCGLLYTCNGLGWKLFFANLAFLVTVVAWSTLAGLGIFLPLSVMGLLRVDKMTEDVGLDFFTITAVETIDQFSKRKL
eukprot:sb/3464068/